MMKNLQQAQIGKHTIGAGYPAFLVFEAGPTHTGVESAKSLAKAAKDSGAHAVKFQMTNPYRLVADRRQMFDYKVLTDLASGAIEAVSEPLFDILKRRYLTHDQWAEVKSYCDEIDICMYATVGYLEDLNHLVDIGCQAIKISSSDVNHIPMLRAAAKTGLNVQIDTGNAKLGEVESAVDELVAHGCENIIIHHCPSGYPARLDGINLRILKTLQSMFPVPVAFSDHSPGWDMDIAAIALGASMIEKTITHDRTTRSAEHMFSLEPKDAMRFVTVMREIQQGLGSARRIFSQEEDAGRTRLRRSMHLRTNLPAGHIVRLSDIEFRRPGFGIPASDWDKVNGKKLRVALDEDHRLDWADFE